MNKNLLIPTSVIPMIKIMLQLESECINSFNWNEVFFNHSQDTDFTNIIRYQNDIGNIYKGIYTHTLYSIRRIIQLYLSESLDISYNESSFSYYNLGYEELIYSLIKGEINITELTVI